VQEAARVSGLPVVVYPNSGERWDAVRRAWTGEPDLRVEDVRAWVDAGARLVGGCCRVGPDAVRTLADLLGAGAGGG
jgi:S-methylmethionine-dependent homocysteine/selenocysteine methylase